MWLPQISYHLRELSSGWTARHFQHRGPLRCLPHCGGARSSRNAEVEVDHWLTVRKDCQQNFILKLNLTSIGSCDNDTPAPQTELEAVIRHLHLPANLT